MKTSKILITGALGHIGSAFIHAVQPGQYASVTLIDNFLTQRYASLLNLPANVKFTFHEEDITKHDLTAHLTGVDAVIHLAAITDAASSFGKPEEVERVNFEGTRKVALACAQSGARLIYLSTTSVYGVSQGWVDETAADDQLKPQSPYADSKIRGERLVQELADSHNLHYTILRFGTIYGPSIGMRFHTAVNKFCWQANLGLPITVWKTALHQKRPYLDLTDAVRALNFVINTPATQNQLYNVLTDNHTVQEVIDAIITQIPKVDIKLVDAQIMNQLSYTVRTERFKAAGFNYSGSLTQGVAQTLQRLAAFRAFPPLG